LFDFTPPEPTLAVAVLLLAAAAAAAVSFSMRMREKKKTKKKKTVNERGIEDEEDGDRLEDRINQRIYVNTII